MTDEDRIRNERVSEILSEYNINLKDAIEKAYNCGYYNCISEMSKREKRDKQDVEKAFDAGVRAVWSVLKAWSRIPNKDRDKYFSVHRTRQLLDTYSFKDVLLRVEEYTRDAQNKKELRENFNIGDVIRKVSSDGTFAGPKLLIVSLSSKDRAEVLDYRGYHSVVDLSCFGKVGENKCSIVNELSSLKTVESSYSTGTIPIN